MKAKIVLLSLALLVVVAVPAIAGGDKCQAANAQVCLKDWSGMKAKGYFGAELDKSTPGVVKVKAIAAGSPAEKAGLMVGDEIVSLNGVAMTADKEALKKAKGEWKAGQTIIYAVKRTGVDHQISATLGTMPEEAFASMLGRHMMDQHMAMTTADASATEKADAKPASASNK